MVNAINLMENVIVILDIQDLNARINKRKNRRKNVKIKILTVQNIKKMENVKL